MFSVEDLIAAALARAMAAQGKAAPSPPTAARPAAAESSGAAPERPTLADLFNGLSEGNRSAAAAQTPQQPQPDFINSLGRLFTDGAGGGDDSDSEDDDYAGEGGRCFGQDRRQQQQAQTQQQGGSSAASEAGRREVREDDTHYLVVFDACGAVPMSIEVSYNNRILHVEFNRQLPLEAGRLRVVAGGLPREGRVTQVLRLNRGAPAVSPGDIKARVINGYLLVRVPKAVPGAAPQPVRAEVLFGNVPF